MPKPTVNYPFEHKMCKATSELSRVLYGTQTACLIKFEPSGEVVSVSFKTSEATWFEEVDHLRLSRQPHLFFDPLNLSGHIWLSWLGLHRSSVERLIGSSFTSLDFQPLNSTSDDRSSPRKLSEFPSVWDVIFEG